MSASVADPTTTTDVDLLSEIWELPAFENDKGYELFFMDDDVNTMEMVTLLLISVFEMDVEKAFELMLRIHNHGRAGVYRGSYDECKEKQDAANLWQAANGMNVFSIIEKVGD